MCRSLLVVLLLTVLLLGACRDSSGSSSSDLTPTPTATVQRSHGEQQWMAEQVEIRKPLEGLTEADLFREFELAVSEKRRAMIRAELIRIGSLTAADKLEAMAAETNSPYRKLPFLSSAAQIRSRILKTRAARIDELRIEMMRLAPDRFSPASRSAVGEAAKEGLVELRDEIHDVASFNQRPEVREAARQSLVVLDLWAIGKTAEETFVLAVERGDLALKEWALLQLRGLPSISSPSRARVVAAMSTLLAEAEERASRFIPTHPHDIAAGYPAEGYRTANTADDRRVQCSMRAFWEKHDPAALSAAFERKAIPRGSRVCGSEYQ